MNPDPRGSLWHRWDPHLHAPGTLLSDQFKGDWDAYLAAVDESSPLIEALGVTDYFCIETYREVRRRKAAGALPRVKLLFPNVELRLDIGTDSNKGVNIHLLFSPQDPNHEEEIQRILGHLRWEYDGTQFSCTLRELAQLGRAYDKSQANEDAALRVGANQFKAPFGQLRELFRRDAWLQQNCLVAVAGSSTDGTAGLQTDASMDGTRREVERFADIVFAGTPKQRVFWLGQHPEHDKNVIEERYGFLKPCLQGSDAHRSERVGISPKDRCCWIKGDLSFEALRQAVVEPAERVWLGPEPPPATRQAISDVHWVDAPWLKGNGLPLNPGLVAVVGPRGSGKTAFVDLIAASSGALSGALSDSSFLKRASEPVDLLGPAQVTTEWRDASPMTATLSDAVLGAATRDSYEEVCYLSQKFVERLCSSVGLAIELRSEMERVVFEATDPMERQEANDFDSLVEALVEPLERKRTELDESIRALGERIFAETALIDSIPRLDKDASIYRDEITKLQRVLEALLPKGNEERAQKFLALETECGAMEKKIEALRRRRGQLDTLFAEVQLQRQTRSPAFLADLRRRYVDIGLSDADWGSFTLHFAGDVDSVLAREKATLDQEIRRAAGTTPAGGLSSEDTPSLATLRAARDEAKKAVGIDTEKVREYERHRQSLTTREAALRSVGAERLQAQGAAARRTVALEARRSEYREVVATILQKEEVLRQLYAPLSDRLRSAEGSLSKIEFVVQRFVDLDGWVARGESLFDLRRDFAFHGYGALAAKASEMLLNAWRTGTADEIADSMEKFRSLYAQEVNKARPPSVRLEDTREWQKQIADWLYSTDHIEIRYGITYAGVLIERLSPGTRGIVLLLLYLAIDEKDPRPLIIDQPEENLDPNSVFAELAPHFREARKRRQVIVVTHNANLVVNTDADQVIVAQSIPARDGGLPTISYKSGALENSEIRRAVCQLLEGGERAFLERERRYRLRWREADRDRPATDSPE
jgi:hypothetical protein